MYKSSNRTGSRESHVHVPPSPSIEYMAQNADPYRVDEETMERLRAVAEPDLGDLEAVCSALADRRRLTILRLLTVSELCVCDLVELFEMEYSKLSYHLKQLREAGLVAADREGNYVTYDLTPTGRQAAEGLLESFEPE